MDERRSHPSALKIKLDENVSAEPTRILPGHDVDTISIRGRRA
jgi:hypothetical protein